MKKVGYCLIISSFALSALVCGFLWGRNYASDEIQLAGQVFPAVEVTAASGSSTNQSYTPSRKKININTATAEEFGTLPGIGPTLAKRIVDHRTQNGPFPCVEALTGVDGIADKTLENILQFITIGGIS